MSSIADLLTVDRIIIEAVARSKKHLLEAASELLSKDEPDLKARDIFTKLCARERQGSTGFGGGVAIPHGRIASAEDAVGGFMRLKHGIDFDAIDGEQVDLVFCLAVPDHCEERHLEMLADLAEFFSDANRRQSLRNATDAKDVLKLIKNWQASQPSS